MTILVFRCDTCKHSCYHVEEQKASKSHIPDLPKTKCVRNNGLIAKWVEVELEELMMFIER
jgi:hypothetical protein